jgi:hypothetical protein
VEAKQLRTAEALRSLVKEIILTSTNGVLAVDVRGDLAEILAISTKKDPLAVKARGAQFEVGAGTRTDLKLRYISERHPPFARSTLASRCGLFRTAA